MEHYGSTGPPERIVSLKNSISEITYRFQISYFAFHFLSIFPRHIICKYPKEST